MFAFKSFIIVVKFEVDWNFIILREKIVKNLKHVCEMSIFFRVLWKLVKSEDRDDLIELFYVYFDRMR